MANQYDLTPTLSQYLDRHMVSQLLDFAQERKVRLRWMSAIRVCLQVAAPILHCGGPQQLTLYYLPSLLCVQLYSDEVILRSKLALVAQTKMLDVEKTLFQQVCVCVCGCYCNFFMSCALVWAYF